MAKHRTYSTEFKRQGRRPRHGCRSCCTKATSHRASGRCHRKASRRFPICPLPLLGPLSRPGGQASMRGGASLPRMMAAPKRLAHTAGQQTAAVRAGVWPLRVQSRLTQSGPIVDILRSAPKSCCAWPRHPATISPTIFAIRAFDRITGRPDACASCRRCASTNPMQSSSSASAPLRTSETPLAVTTSSVSV